MWSLPDIKRMNDQAVLDYEKNKSKTANEILKDQDCDYCQEPATNFQEYYDPFSKEPKGYVFTCESESCQDCTYENYFNCVDCGKYHINNYTWENYFVNTEEGDIVCINCAFDRFIAEDNNWINKDELDKIDFEYIRKCQHVIPVEGKHHEKSLCFHGNVEFDSMSGSGLSESDPVKALKSIAEIALNQRNMIEATTAILKKENDYEEAKVILILDAAYQFAVSIGVYSRRKYS